jgi:UDP-glucose 4-epimerase
MTDLFPAHVVQAFRGSRVLITGGAGFIGGHIGRTVAALGGHVRVLDDLSGGFADNVPEGGELFRASVLDTAVLTQAIAGCDFVFHQAAMVSVPVSVEHPAECTQVNIVGTQNVLEAARKAGVRRVMFAASAAAYGNNPVLPCHEDRAADAWSPYAMSKVAGELLCQTYSRNFGLSTAALRYFNVFGERQNANSAYAAVISAFEKALRAGTRPRIFGDGGQTRDFVHVSNVVRANLLAAASPRPLCGEPINIGTGVRTDLLSVLRHMAAALGRPDDAEFLPARAGDIRDSVADISRARDLLGYEVTIDFAAGIRRMFAAPTGNTSAPAPAFG